MGEQVGDTMVVLKLVMVLQLVREKEKCGGFDFLFDRREY